MNNMSKFKVGYYDFQLSGEKEGKLILLKPKK
jgi:hypothetical protein